VVGHPIGGGRTTPVGGWGLGGRSHSMALGVVRPPPMAKSKKKKIEKKKNHLALGVAGPPPRAVGVALATLDRPVWGGWGGRSHTTHQLGWSGHSQWGGQPPFIF
jgi:hypothetical protein